MNDQIDSKKAKVPAHFAAKLLVVFACTLGATVIVVAPFTLSFTNALGTLGTVVASFVILASAALFAGDGLKLANAHVQQTPNALFVPILVYITSIALQIAASVVALRLLAFALDTFVGIDVRWFHIP